MYNNDNVITNILQNKLCYEYMLILYSIHYICT